MKDMYLVQNNKGLAARNIGGEMVIMTGDSRLLTLDEVATAIWLAADGSRTVSQIVNDIVCQQFEVEPETAWRDVEDFLDQLATTGIVQLSPVPVKPQE